MMKNVIKNACLFVSKKNFLIFLTSAIVLTFAIFPIFYLHSQNREKKQDREKRLEKSNEFNSPVEIILAKSKLGNIKIGENFSADKDWFKDLSVNVRNNSEKPITHISISIRFPRPKSEDGLDYVVPIEYGENPFPSKNGEFLNNTATPIMPKESVELQLSEEAYIHTQSQLMEMGYGADIKNIKIYVTTIGFSDNTIWMGGKSYNFDKKIQEK
ncbi:MAG: hypothetical protein WKF71_08145 [Pyrinomonadaceae bacterium]